MFDNVEYNTWSLETATSDISLSLLLLHFKAIKIIERLEHILTNIFTDGQ